MDLSGKRVVVSGGTGALGTAVVGLLLEAGAACIVPYVHDGEMERFAHRGHGRMTLVKVATWPTRPMSPRSLTARRSGPRSTLPAASPMAKSPTPTRPP